MFFSGKTMHYLPNILKQGGESDMRRSYLDSSRTQVEGERSLIGEESFRYFPYTGRKIEESDREGDI